MSYSANGPHESGRTTDSSWRKKPNYFGNETHGSCSHTVTRNKQSHSAKTKKIKDPKQELRKLPACLKVHVVGGVDRGGHAINGMRHRHPSSQLRVVFDIINSESPALAAEFARTRRNHAAAYTAHNISAGIPEYFVSP